MSAAATPAPNSQTPNISTPAAPLEARRAALARHEGVWEGMHRHYDADGQKTDEHKSRVICRFPDDGPHAYIQTDIFSWKDGRTQTRDHPARLEGGRLLWDTDFVQGWAADVTLDEGGRTTLLHWTKPSEPGLDLYEMVQISDDGQSRARTWHWLRNDRLFARTLVDERKISDSWAGL